ncbi:MAG: AzlC family ABC transporter permease [Actinomycetota bacterium]|nr:AzlC family ABC transporter permease [Actinomycetota bacterium]
MDNATVEANWTDGVRAISPILLGITPFGLIFGVAAANADLPLLAAWASSFIILAGASQIAIIDVLDGGGAPVVAILTAIVINARMLMYSADMGRYTAAEPLGTRLFAAYLLTDQAYLVSTQRFPEPESARGFVPFYLGAGVTLWTTWQLSTTTGILLGAAIPTSWSLEFAIPLTFMALLVLAIKDRSGLLAAVVGGTVAVLATALPYHLGLLVGAACGIAAGMVSERWFR